MKSVSLIALLLLLMPQSAAAGDKLISTTAEQTTYIVVCNLCTPAEVNWANPLIVGAVPGADVLAYLAFELPTAPGNMRLESAKLMLLQWQDEYHPYAWTPAVALNYSGSDLDLSGLIGPEAPLPESDVAPHLDSTLDGRDHWDVTGLIAPLLGERVLFVLTPPAEAVAGSRYQFEGVRPDGDYRAQPFALLTFVDAGTPAESISVGRVKGLFEGASR